LGLGGQNFVQGNREVFTKLLRLKRMSKTLLPVSRCNNTSIARNAQVGLKLVCSSNPATSDSWVAGITGACHHILLR
jgi:hypothetical protein